MLIDVRDESNDRPISRLTSIGAAVGRNPARPILGSGDRSTTPLSLDRYSYQTIEGPKVMIFMLVHADSVDTQVWW